MIARSDSSPRLHAAVPNLRRRLYAKALTNELSVVFFASIGAEALNDVGLLPNRVALSAILALGVYYLVTLFRAVCRLTT